MTREKLTEWLLSRGWTRDRFGHFHKGGYRMTLTSHAIRLEVKSNSRWIRIRSAYLRDVSLTDDNTLSGLTAKGCIPKGRIR